jgi:anti-sigma28 factor (negative regulator of flagellin synthesis)
MPEFEINSRFQYQNRKVEQINMKSAADQDVIMEQILQNLNTTSMGQVLKKIASLPEVRKDKVLTVRRQITDGQYDLNERLNIALDKVIEDLTA